MPTQAKTSLKSRRLDNLYSRMLDYQNQEVLKIFSNSVSVQLDLEEFKKIHKAVTRVLNYNKVELVKVENYGCYVDFFNKRIYSHYFPMTWEEAYLLTAEVCYLLVGYHGILAAQQLFYLVCKEYLLWDEKMFKRTLSYVDSHHVKNLT